jgi:hypothetical protein
MARLRLGQLVLTTASIMSVLMGGASAAPVQLQLKLEKGKTYYQRTVIRQQRTQTIMGEREVVEQGIGIGMKLDVLDVDAQGNMRIRRTFNWSMVKRTDPTQGDLHYDSSKQTSPPARAEVFAALLGQSYIVQISPKGQVLDIDGVEDLQEAIRKKLPAGAETRAQMSALTLHVDTKGIKELTATTLAVYPDQPVQQGESWTERSVTPTILGLTSESKSTLQKRAAGVATITIVSSRRSDPAVPPRDMGRMKMKADLSGTQECTIRVEEATGLILGEQSRERLTGEMKVSDSTHGEPLMTVPIVVEGVGEFEMSDKPWEPLAP